MFESNVWEGIYKVEDEDLEGNSVLNKIGRWVITEDYTMALGNGYSIHHSRLHEDDWLSHIIPKGWLYDPTDMIDALELAHSMFVPDSTPEQRQEWFNAQLRVCFDRRVQPFYPYRMFYERQYIVNYMDDQEKSAFAEFLSKTSGLPKLK